MCGGPAETKPLLENTPKRKSKSEALHLFGLRARERSECIHIRLLCTCAFIKICDVEMHITEDELVFFARSASRSSSLVAVRMQILMKNVEGIRRKRAQSVITFDFFETILRAIVGPVFSFLET